MRSVGPYPYSTSHPLEEVDLNGARVLVKDLAHPMRSKPRFLHDPGREIETYRSILSPAGIGPRLHGAEGTRLAVEKVEGVELWQVGELAIWEAAARWLSEMHRTLVPYADSPHLIRYDADWYRLWLDRARAFSGSLVSVERIHDEVIERLLGQPRTVVHGELYASNVIVSDGRIVPVDWEMAGSGPGLVDLAALAAGWPDADHGAIVAAYGSVDSEALDCCRLHLALRWLGWSRAWEAPSQHAYDWRAEALGAAERLEAAA